MRRPLNAREHELGWEQGSSPAGSLGSTCVTTGLVPRLGAGSEGPGETGSIVVTSVAGQQLECAFFIPQAGTTGRPQGPEDAGRQNTCPCAGRSLPPRTGSPDQDTAQAGANEGTGVLCKPVQPDSASTGWERAEGSAGRCAWAQPVQLRVWAGEWPQGPGGPAAQAHR